MVDGLLLEAQFNGVWTTLPTVSSGGSRAVEIDHYGSDGIASMQPATLVATIDNSPDRTTGRYPFTPDSPMATNWPYIAQNTPVRATFVLAAFAISSVRFLGWADTWVDTPVDTGDPTTSRVVLTASDIWSRHARRKLLSPYGEGVKQYASGLPFDHYPMDDDSDAVFLRNAYVPPNSGLYTAKGHRASIVSPNTGSDTSGTFQLGQADAGVLIDGIATQSRGDSVSAVSPVMLTRLRNDAIPKRISAWTLVSENPVGTVPYDDLMSGYDDSGTLLWRAGPELVSGQIRWGVWDGSAVVGTDSPISWHFTGVAADNAWRWFSILFNDDGSANGTVNIAIRDKYVPDRIFGNVGGFTTGPWWTTAWITFGGLMSPFRRGKQANTFIGSYGGIYVQYRALTTTSVGTSPSFLGAAGTAFTGLERSTQLIGYGAPAETVVGGGVGGSDPDDTPVQLSSDQAGSDLLTEWAKHALTVGGVVATRPDGKRMVRGKGSVTKPVRPITVTLTVDAEADLDAPAAGWTWDRPDRPTRQTAASPAGSVTVVGDPVSEAAGVISEGSTLAVNAGTPAVAEAAAAWPMAGSGRSRLESFGLNPATAQNSLWSTLYVLQIGDRVRVTGLPALYLGVSQLDCYVMHWNEAYGGTDLANDVLFTFDVQPADDPSGARADDLTYGRAALGDGATAVTGGTAMAATSTGTLILTGRTLSTKAASYPLSLNWNGERVTVNAAPAGSTSPQTVTVTARGVSPTAARAHVAGEPVEIWNAARAAR